MGMRGRVFWLKDSKWDLGLPEEASPEGPQRLPTWSLNYLRHLDCQLQSILHSQTLNPKPRTEGFSVPYDDLQVPGQVTSQVSRVTAECGVSETLNPKP